MYKDVILIQKRELENRLQETYIERKLSVPWDLSDDLIKVISGPRRAGKSFFAIHLLRQTGSYGYVNFDDERLIAIEDYDEIVSAVNTVYGNPRYLLFDEIQNLPRWELFVNRLQRQGFRLLITGSNANLLSSELATHLTGRHAVCVLFPFSFGEYLAVSGEQRTAIEKYIRHLQDAYLVFSLPRFSFKLKDQAGHNKKIYCNDNGLAVSSGFRFSADRGVLYENLAAGEVDFVVKEGPSVARLIQVCSDISNPKTLNREMQALIKASQELHCDELWLLNDRSDRTETIQWQGVERRIRLMPLWQWLDR